MYGTQQKIPSEGGQPETLYTQQSVVCIDKKTSWCVFCTYQKRSLYEEKEIQEIKEKRMGKWIKCFVLVFARRKRSTYLKDVDQEYNWSEVLLSGSHGTGSYQHIQEIRFFFFVSLHSFQHLRETRNAPPHPCTTSSSFYFLP